MVAPTNKAKPAANKKGGKDDKSVDETVKSEKFWLTKKKI